jgi:CheY-like chemotaxis protein
MAGQAKVRVLIVEDRLVQAQLIRKMLEVLGCEAQTAANGREALTMLHGFKPQVVFLDIGLPDMDGYQLATSIRKDLDFKSVPIIAVTGFGFDSDKEKSRAAGIDQHLVKPISVDDLQQALCKLGLAT